MSGNSPNENMVTPKLPDVKATQVAELVRENLESIDSINEQDIVTITGAELNKQNKYSNRSGAAINIEYMREGLPKNKKIWVKRLVNSKIAFDEMNWVYKTLQSNNIEAPVPQPYFCDDDYNLIFLNMISGANLKDVVFKHSLLISKSNNNLQAVFHDIGRWLASYNMSTATGNTTTLSEIISAISVELDDNNHFSEDESKLIKKNLDNIGVLPIAKQKLPLVRPHNDFTLRNLFLREDGSFCIIDWDAMVHPQFLYETLGEWDLAALFINLQSMLRFYPVTSKSRIHALCEALLSGYEQENIQFSNVLSRKSIDNLLYVLTVQYYLGLNSDRPMYVIYHRNFGSRYIRKLRKNLIKGTVYIS